MSSGKYVFAQLLHFIDRYEFDKCVSKYNSDFQTRDFNCWNQFIQLFFGQLTSRNSLRDICTCLNAHKNKLYHLGIGSHVNQSTLSRANQGRGWRIYADFGQYLMDLVRPLHATNPVPNVNVCNEVCIEFNNDILKPETIHWAPGNYSRGQQKYMPFWI